MDKTNINLHRESSMIYIEGMFFKYSGDAI